ncbi:M20 family metallopeptidase [Actinocrispum wychmicini]|uniref:Acetylornithine deacetylase/succinyl-diaminopimelate desuccinylase-like protein n=1 Tax=Actinocrispum wychmicini TaxID=1213861 RepID=A0A4V6NNY4_9PSEU|nr:peptidase dimerization domain-containing protein [Actinocrispum wychmicini]TCO59920.1 acetylornithine deacetylase/succinyl-diaminopimelate desuccinylase-like protein [Actinocrispum wychmicini]
MTNDRGVPIKALDSRANWAKAARAAIDESELAELCMAATDIPSPTGAERELAETLGHWMRGAGLDSKVQLIDERQANLVTRVGTNGPGVQLLLLAPLDTAFIPGPEDAAWIGELPRPDFALPSCRDGDRIIGLGAENPKAFAVCALATALAVHRVGIPLAGELVVGLVGGSMPTLGSPLSSRRNIGLGVGTAFLLDHGVQPDAAIVLKPGYHVVHEEVGFAWFRVTVGGSVGYTGSRHKGEYRNAVVAAARVASALEDWFAEYTARNSSGQVAPQGAVTAIHGGDQSKPAFNPASCEFMVDLRVSPRTSLADVTAQLTEVITVLRASQPDVSIDLELLAGQPGTSTPSDSWVVRRLTSAWEDVEGRPHQSGLPGSGMSDGGVLRRSGVPTARIGLPPPVEPGPYQGFSMGVADPAGMSRLVDLLIRTVIDVTTRTRKELED